MSKNVKYPNQALQLRLRIAVTLAGRAALSDAGADLLEQIHAHGSLSEAARRLHFSYRRAWLLLDGMNHAWPAPLVTTATGGRHGGGASLTPLGHSVLGAYRHLQVELEYFLDRQTQDFHHTIRSHRG